MSVDLTKPIRLKNGIHALSSIRCLGTLDTSCRWPIVLAVKDPGSSSEYLYRVRIEELENIPESRWLNVYVPTGQSRLAEWHASRSMADDCAPRPFSRLGVLEDKQDGSPLIFHPV